VATLSAIFSSGTHPLSATYSGDTNFNGISGTLSEVVNGPAGAATVTTIGSSANPSVFGQTVTFSALVTGSAGVPTGDVTFNAGPLSAVVALDITGTALFTTSALPVGSSSVAAAYAGDAANAGSTSGILGQTVNQAATTTAVTSPATAFVGATVTFTATVTVNSPGSGTPTGSVAFVLDGTTTLCPSVTLQPGGIATCASNTLSTGGHTIVATYSGDPNFGGSSGQTTSETCGRGF